MARRMAKFGALSPSEVSPRMASGEAEEHLHQRIAGQLGLREPPQGGVRSTLHIIPTPWGQLIQDGALRCVEEFLV